MQKIKLPSKRAYFSSEKFSPLEMFREMLIKLNAFAKPIGCNVFSPEYCFYNWKMLCVSTLNVKSFLEMISYIHSNREDSVQCFFGLLFIPAVVQSTTRLYSFIFRREKLITLFYKMDKFYQTYDEEWSRKILEKNILNSCHVGVFLSSLLIIGCAFIIIYPAVFYIIFDQLVLHFGFRLFWVDWQTPLGYTLNFINDIICVIFFLQGTMLVCIDITMCVLCAYSQYDILNVYLNQLNQLIIEGGSKKEEIKSKIAMITDLHNYIILFMDDFNSLFVPYYFIEIGSLMIQTSLSLFAIASMNFYPGYIIIMITMYQMLVPCVFGTFLTLKGDEYYEHLCNIKWYSLSIPDQKSIALLLTGAYKERTLSTGLVTLNLESFVEICKATYSYYTLISSFS